MEQHEESESGFVPDANERRGLRAVASTISPLRSRWRMPAAVTTMAVVAALCLNTGSAAHATASPAVKPASISAHAAVHTGAGSSLTGHVEAAADGVSKGGVHGALNMYDGVGGGLEFWFDPNTGDLTVAIGSGVGEGGGGVIGTYGPGTVPEVGAYLYANADLSAGTVASVNVSGTYSLTDGKLVGSINTTVEGRTLTISSDGGSSFDANVVAVEGAAGFTGAVGIQYVFKFNITDVINYIWNAILNAFTGEYSLLDSDDTGDETYAYADDSSTDDSDLTTDDSSDDSSSSDASSDSSDDSGGGDSGGGGCDYNAHLVADQPSSETTKAHSTVIIPAEEIEDDGSCD